MADIPGALLLRSGILRPPDLQAAVALRAREGGSLGECLVRLGLIDEERLANFYQKRLMITRVPDHRLASVKSNALELVPADMAAEFRVIPLELDAENHLVLAMSDPTDNHAVDEVAFFADRFVVRVVATETAVREAIERHYDIQFPSPRATEPIGAAVPSPAMSSLSHPAARLPAATAPPSVTAPRAPAPSAAAAPAATPPSSPSPSLPTQPAAENDEVVLLTKVKYADPTPLPFPVPPPAEDFAHEELPVDGEVDGVRDDDAAPILLTERKSTPTARKRHDTLPGFAQMTVPDPPLSRLRAATERDAIAAAVLDYFALMMRRAGLFIMRKDVLVGYDMRGAEVDVQAIKNVIIHVGAPSIFHDVIASRLPYRGPLPETPANRAFAHALGGVSSEVLLMPVAVRDRVIAVVFADGAAQPLPHAALHACVREAGLAYERLILQAKAQPHTK